MSLAQRLAHYSLQFGENQPYCFKNLSAAVQQAAVARVLDALGCAMAAQHSRPARIARGLSPVGTSPMGPATLWGTSQQTTADWATFVNGIAVRYLDCNDTYLSKEPAHPSDNLSAILAVAEAVGASGAQALSALVLAYEVQCRLCDAASIRAQGWDHVTYGAFSVSLAVACLLDLTQAQRVHAQALAAAPHVAMRQTRVGELSHWKGCAFANMARNAVVAAYMAREGMTGPSDIFEGEMAFFRQVSRQWFDLPVLGGENGAAFMLPETYIKHFPVEYHAQSAVEAAIALHQDVCAAHGKVPPEAIADVCIESFDAAVDIIGGFPEHWRPQSRETADHSMPYCTTVALLDGDITLASFDEARLVDPAVLAVLQRVRVQRNPELTAGYPAGIPNRITLTLADGQQIQRTVAHPLGHARQPMSLAQVQAKIAKITASAGVPRAVVLAWLAWAEALPDAKTINFSTLPTWE